MTLWHALLLGIVQGITEFLPISSSGHLALGQYFLGLEHLQDHVLFNLVCHLGTLLAIVYTLFPLIKESLCSNRRLFGQLAIATLPLFPLVFLLRPLKATFDQPWLWGPCFLLSATLLFAGLYRRPAQKIQKSKSIWRDSLTIGLFQAIAIFPGISRSGSTISAARLLGWSKEQAMQFSFLLAVPAILGGTVWEGWHAWQTSSTAAVMQLGVFATGFTAAFFVGCLSLRLLAFVIQRDKWIYFAWYCLAIGLAATAYFNNPLGYAG